MKNTLYVCILFLAQLFIFSSCKKDPPMPPLKFYEGQGILSVGQTGLFYLKDSIQPIELKFVKVVSDSRCPSGSVCVWEGEIKVKILLDKTVTLEVPTDHKPAEFKGYKISIASAKPYPSINYKIKESEYKVEFKISK